jgi:hypothetical protein
MNRKTLVIRVVIVLLAALAVIEGVSLAHRAPSTAAATNAEANVQ